MSKLENPYVGSGQPDPLEAFTALYLQLIKHCLVETRLWFDLKEYGYKRSAWTDIDVLGIGKNSVYIVQCKNWPESTSASLTETVMVDFDATSFRKVKYWALRTLAWFRLQGFLILKSSEGNYHVIFDRKVSWKQNVKIVAWLALQAHDSKLVRWLLMQCIKEGSTLRISPKKDKPSPRVVYWYGKQEGQIRSFLECRHMLKRFMRKLKTFPKPQFHDKRFLSLAY